MRLGLPKRRQVAAGTRKIDRIIERIQGGMERASRDACVPMVRACTEVARRV